jgi:hypothetical protein
MGSGVALPPWSPGKSVLKKSEIGSSQVRTMRRVHPRPRIQASRLISTGQLHVLPRFHLRPINRVVYPESSVARRPLGDLILGWVSHLDAFSDSPLRT